MTCRTREVQVFLLLAALFAAGVAGGCGSSEREMPVVDITSPAVERSDKVIIPYILYDSDSWPAMITVQYSLDGGVTYQTATSDPSGDGTGPLLTSQSGVAHCFVWDSVYDEGYVNHDDVKFVITAITREVSLPSYTGTFTLGNFALAGCGWEANVQVDDDTGSAAAQSPRLAADGDNVYAVWVDYRDEILNGDIRFSWSIDAGVTWTTPSVLVNNDGAGNVQSEPDIACDGSGNVYVVWTDNRDADKNIYMASGNDPGGGFVFSVVDSMVNTATGLGDCTEPVVSASEGPTVIYVAWTDSQNIDLDIYYSSSTDLGATWAAEERVYLDAGATDQHEPAITGDGAGNVFVAWTEDSDNNIYAAVGNDPGGGFTFGAPVRVDNDDAAGSGEPSIAVYGANVYVAYSDDRDGDQDIYVATSIDSGVSFATNLKASDDGADGDQYEPSIAVSATGDVYVVFTDERIEGESIYFTSSTTPSVSFEDDVRIDNDYTTAAQSEPDIAFGTRIYVIFTDGRNLNEDVYFVRSKN